MTYSIIDGFLAYNIEVCEREGVRVERQATTRMERRELRQINRQLMITDNIGNLWLIFVTFMIVFGVLYSYLYPQSHNESNSAFTGEHEEVIELS